MKETYIQLPGLEFIMMGGLEPDFGSRMFEISAPPQL
jgi:hypothetical protein